MIYRMSCMPYSFLENLRVGPFLIESLDSIILPPLSSYLLEVILRRALLLLRHYAEWLSAYFDKIEAEITLNPASNVISLITFPPSGQLKETPR